MRTPNAPAVLVAACFAAAASARCVRNVSAPLTPSVSRTADDNHLAVMHFNDLHGALDRAAEISCVIRQAREECARLGCRVLVLNGGDLFGNTMVSERFKGKAEIAFMEALGVDASVPGNHDTDFGAEVFEERIGEMRNAVAANLTRAATDKPLLPSHAVLQAGSMRVGVIGLTHPSIPRYRSEYRTAADPVEAVAGLMPDMEGKSDVQIALTHLDNPHERKLGQSVPGLDAVIGGHDHIAPKDFCGETTRPETPVCETPANGEYVGRLDMRVEGGMVNQIGHQLIAVKSCAGGDSNMEAVVRPYLAAVEQEQNEVLGIAGQNFINNRDVPDGQNGANGLVVRAMKEATGESFAMINATGVRATIRKGPVTKGQINELVFDDQIVVIELTGGEIRAAMDKYRSRNRYFAVAGFTYQTQLDPNQTYRVATTGFLTDQKQGTFRNVRIIAQGGSLREAVASYLKNHQGGTGD